MASKRAVRRRSCNSKVRHPSGHVAKHVAWVLRGKHGKMHRYRCKFCGGWHIGH